MADLIDRQAAIKAIENLQDCYNGFSDTYDKACIIGVLEEVPSAEPTQKNESNTLDALDCVSRQAAIDAMKNLCENYTRTTSTKHPHINFIIEELEALPSAQPERKKGKWIYNSPVTMKCDQCGFVIKDWDLHRFKFCPRCGHRMEVVE